MLIAFGKHKKKWIEMIPARGFQKSKQGYRLRWDWEGDNSLWFAGR